MKNPNRCCIFYGRRQNQIKSKQRIIGNWKAQSKTVYGKSTGLKHFFNLNLSNLNRSKLRCHLSFSFQVAAAIETAAVGNCVSRAHLYQANN
ncbi:Uncharacterized protein TCM_037374 [Theobroma cacao]|uniref:Uncharacterized protein n=1 Tax=Theobroma cacao TaxID=3641 RepID=A0A061GJF5_THECC|nr:Uncharacterized protein TCM_037374 [Theobroma cacao]